MINSIFGTYTYSNYSYGYSDFIDQVLTNESFEVGLRSLCLECLVSVRCRIGFYLFCPFLAWLRFYRSLLPDPGLSVYALKFVPDPGKLSLNRFLAFLNISKLLLKFVLLIWYH